MHIIVIQDGRTALMHASMKGHDVVVSQLLQYNAKPNIKDNVRDYILILALCYVIMCVYYFDTAGIHCSDDGL